MFLQLTPLFFAMSDPSTDSIGDFPENLSLTDAIARAKLAGGVHCTTVVTVPFI